MADAVVIPGAMFGPAAGLLTYAAAVAERRAVTVHRHFWSQPPPDAFQPHIRAGVRDEISPLLDAVGGTPLLIAKSLGTTAAALAAERRVPAVWLTPILTVPWLSTALSRATAPFLLVGGTARSDVGRDPGRRAIAIRAGDRRRRSRPVRPPARSPTRSRCSAAWSPRWRPSWTPSNGQPEILHPPRGCLRTGRRTRMQLSYPQHYEALNS